ncbi:protein-disulfide reductase DsbD family protein [Rhodovibrio sodomensis]|nr:protein-disulfide reductase DsbD domain-containing protein [Rhodovibrio sodomensis]
MPAQTTRRPASPRRRAAPRRWLSRLAPLAMLAALLLAAAPPLQAASSDWASNEQGRLRLVSASQGTGASAQLRLGLQFQMADGWKIYWRSPGEAGYPPQVDWSGSQNLETAKIRWPVPHRFELFGLQTFGYAGEVVLPVDARAQDPSKPVRVEAKVDYLTCAEICVPRKATLALTLPADAGGPSQQAHLIDQFRDRVPGEGAAAGLDLRQARLVSGGDQPVLELTTHAQPPFRSPDAIVEGLPETKFGKPAVTLNDGGREAVLRLTGERGRLAEGTLAGKTVTVTLFDGKRGLERQITLGADRADAGAVSTASPGGTDTGGGLTWTGPRVAAADYAAILGLAVLGGLILNLMPCVLPVLSLKLLSVIGQGGRERRHVRQSFLASAAGIVTCFLLLAAGAAGLKAAGLAVGWGVQFQQPLFLVALTLILTLFACNLFGVFEIQLPGRLTDRLARAGGAPAAPGHREGLAGHFATGMFATLLATPCSAPFLGTAIGFALSRGLLEILAIFLALGIGLALPYLAVAAVPALAAKLPRPGRWMIAVRRVLGVALAGTAVWLLSVLAAEDGQLTALVVAGLLVALGALIALRLKLAGGLRRAVPAGAAVLALAAFAAPLTLQAPADARGPATAGAEDAADWRPLDRGAIDRLVADGKVVFVDVTAEWCITCQVNKKLVLDSETVQARLDQPGVVRMRADWTKPSDRIANYLASFGRYGIPFNAVYGPGAPDGIALPELLNTSGVLDAIERARGRQTARR